MPSGLCSFRCVQLEPKLLKRKLELDRQGALPRLRCVMALGTTEPSLAARVHLPKYSSIQTLALPLPNCATKPTHKASSMLTANTGHKRSPTPLLGTNRAISSDSKEANAIKYPRVYVFIIAAR